MGMDFIETSAKENINVENTFLKLTEGMKSLVKKRAPGKERQRNIIKPQPIKEKKNNFMT